MFANENLNSLLKKLLNLIKSFSFLMMLVSLRLLLCLGDAAETTG